MRLTFATPITADDLGGDTPARTVSGIAAVYDVTVNASTGPVRFAAGSLPLDGPAPKLFLHHDPTQAVGTVVERVNLGDAVGFTARISETRLGDEALTLAKDGVLDQVSVGVDVEAYDYDGNVLVVKASRWTELSMLPGTAAFGDLAPITQVAAEAGDVEDETEETESGDLPAETDSKEDVATMETVETATTPVPLTLGRPFRRPSAGEYVAAMIGGGTLPRVEAVVAEEDTGDIAGLLPEPLVGEVWNNLRFLNQRPMVSALGTRAMPAAGETFYRRKVTQHVDVAEQVAQGDELASQALVVQRVTVNKRTLGGVLDLSEQSAVMSDPALAGLVLEDMALVYAQQTDILLCAEIVAGMGTATATVTDFTDGDEVITDLYAAAAEVRAAGYQATHLLVSTDVWAKLGAAKDSGGNRIFPYLGPSNAAGTSAGVTSPSMNPLGLTLVVDDNLVVSPATSACIVLAAPVVEFYEDNRGAIRVDMPATLQTRLAFRGYCGVADIDLTAGALSLI